MRASPCGCGRHLVSHLFGLGVLGLLGVALLGLAGCQSPLTHTPSPTVASPSRTPIQDEWSALRQRPLQLPTLAPDATCPSTTRIRSTPTSAQPWANRPSFTRVRAPGCYAYQVDGTGFTEIIVFQAQPQ